MDGTFHGTTEGGMRPAHHTTRSEGRARDSDGARPGHPAASAYADLPAHDARALTRGGAQAILMLDGMAYSLRITRAGKLILTK